MLIQRLHQCYQVAINKSRSKKLDSIATKRSCTSTAGRSDSPESRHFDHTKEATSNQKETTANWPNPAPML